MKKYRSCFDFYDEIPDAFLNSSCEDFCKTLEKPTVYFVKGNKEPALLVTILLHGNEQTGFYAMQTYLRRILKSKTKKLTRSLYLLVANPKAASSQHRFLSVQPDFNRIWDGKGGQESKAFAWFIEEVCGKGLLAAVDIHNTSGVNPCYSCIANLDPVSLNLASLFTRTVVNLAKPLGTHVVSFAKRVPAVTLECGKSNSASGITLAVNFIDACMQLEKTSLDVHAPSNLAVYVSKARVKVPVGASYIFASEPSNEYDFVFCPKMEKMNFSPQEPDTFWGYAKEGFQLEVEPFYHQDDFEPIFEYKSGKIHSVTNLVPAMLTKDISAIKNDCLGYIMHPVMG